MTKRRFIFGKAIGKELAENVKGFGAFDAV